MLLFARGGFAVLPIFERVYTDSVEYILNHVYGVFHPPPPSPCVPSPHPSPKYPPAPPSQPCTIHPVRYFSGNIADNVLFKTGIIKIYDVVIIKFFSPSFRHFSHIFIILGELRCRQIVLQGSRPWRFFYPFFLSFF